MEISIGGERTVLGTLADSVQEVIELESSQIETAPRIGTHLKTEFIKGMGKKDTLFIIILDIDKVFATDEISLVQAVGKEEEPSEENQSEA